MARLFPKIDPSEIQNPGERKVAEALVSQLPSRIEIFHGFHWMGDGRKGTVVEGECDFVVLDPEYGLLFVEVKVAHYLLIPKKWSGAERPLEVNRACWVKIPLSKLEKVCMSW
jgi:hypothetical protein